MEKNDILGGFDAIFDQFTPNAGIKKDEQNAAGGLVDPANDYEDLDPDKLDKDDNTPDPDFIETKEINKEDEEAVEDKADQAPSEIVSTFFDAIAETIGWDGIDDESKPKTVEELVEYMKTAVEEGSTPNYANEEVAKIDEFVRNGGNIKDYFDAISSDYDSVKIDTVESQRAILAEFLTEKGYSESQIQRKLDKYEDADILEDEAIDALESLKELKKNNSEALLEAQKIESQRLIEEQQNFRASVVSEIEALTHIRGIKIHKDDNKALIDYILKVESDGRTRYQKDYAKSSKNLIESAYFTMKGDSLIDQAKKKGETSAVDKFKQALSSSKVSSSKQHINDGSATPLWALVSKQLVK